MTWFKLFEWFAAAIANLMGWLLGWLRNRELLDAGGAAEETQQKAARDEIALADKARDTLRVELGRDPSGLRDDDGFRRRD